MKNERFSYHLKKKKTTFHPNLLIMFFNYLPFTYDYSKNLQKPQSRTVE